MRATFIYEFTSRLQLLEGLRDAVEGHWHLWSNGIMHHNVSTDSILLGSPAGLNSSGSCGVLIDLDLAVPTNKSDTPVLGRLLQTGPGTHAFQSYMILSTRPQQAQFSAPHDYLDDLESFFWVLIWFTLGYDVVETEDRLTLTPTDENFGQIKYLKASPDIAAGQKHTILSKEKIWLSGGWGPTIQNMVSEMGRFLSARVRSKITARDAQIARNQSFKHHLQPLLNPEIQKAAQADYPLFIGIIDRAIEKLRLKPDESSVSQQKTGGPSAQIPHIDSAGTGGAPAVLGTKRARGADNGDDDDSLKSTRHRNEGSQNQVSKRIDFGPRYSKSRLRFRW